MVLYVSTPSTAFIPIEVFDRVQAILSARSVTRGGGKNPPYSLTSLVFCACGSGTHYENKNEALFLSCNRHVRLGVCPEKAVKAVPIERAVFEEIKSLFLDDEDLDARFIELVRHEAEDRARERAESVAAFKAELQTVDALLEDKMMATIPADAELKETWDSIMEKLAARKRAAKIGLAGAMAAISVHSMAGFRKTGFREQLDELINATPHVTKSEIDVRTRALLRAVVKRVDLVRLDQYNVSAKMLFDFSAQVGGSGDPRAIIERTVEIHMPHVWHVANEEMEKLVADGSLDLSEEDCAELDANEFVQRGMIGAVTKAHHIYHAMLALTTTNASSLKCSKATGVAEVTLQNYLAAYRKPGDALRLGKILAAVRPDLSIDHTRLDRGKGQGPKSYSARFKEVDHPLLSHPLASTASDEARLSDDEFDAIRRVIPSGSFFFRRAAMLRKVVDAFLWLVRTNKYRNLRPSDLSGNPVALHLAKIVNGHELAVVTKALLEHAGLAEPGEVLKLPDLPPATRGRRKTEKRAA